MYIRTMGFAFFPAPRIYIPLPLTSLPLPLAAQRNGEKRICSPVYLLMLPVCKKLALSTGIHRGGPCPIEYSCGAVSNALPDGAEGLHFSAI